MSLLLRRNLLPSLQSSAQVFSHSMRFRHIHTTILRSSRNGTITDRQRQNTSHLFEPPANKPPARPRISDFTDSDMVKCTIAIRHHMRNGQCDTALLLFNSMPRKSKVTYGTMISGYFSNGEFKMAQQLFDEMPVKNLFAQNIMIRWNIKNNNLRASRLLFDEMSVKNVVPWTTLLSGYAQNGLMDEAKRVFDEIPDKDVVSWNTLLSGYVQNGLMDEAQRVFDEIPDKDVVSWTTLLSGYAQNGLMDEAKRVFDDMPIKNVVSWNAILSGYVQNGLMDKARRVFDDMPIKNVVSWNAILSGYVQNGLMDKARIVFDEMSVKDAVSWRTILSGYMQNGLLDEAKSVFYEMPVKGVVCWNTIIISYARHGFGKEALQHFESMKQASIQPNEVTMVGVLTACSLTGLVDKGKHYFYSMSQDHGIVPNIHHYNCMIDLLGRAGHLHEAQNLMKSMTFEPDAVTWGALLSASRVHGNTKLGEKAAEMLLELEPGNSSAYVLLSKLYAASGRWEDAKKTRLKMRDRGISKRPGYSWVEVLNKIHKFYVGDFTHPDSESIRAFLEELYLRMKEEGYVPATKSALHDVDEEEKQHTLKFHSERLAIAYGIMKIPSGRPVRIFKNLRVCEDCHTAIKHIVKITGRLIILRDVNRFHHFEGGVCNCGDYW